MRKAGSRNLCAPFVTYCSWRTSGNRSIGLINWTHCNGNSVYIFLFWELRGLSPSFHIHVSVSDLYFPGSVHIFPPAEKADPSWEYIIRIWMWKLGLRPRYSFPGIICFKFSAFCLCSAESEWLNLFSSSRSYVQFSITNRQEQDTITNTNRFRIKTDGYFRISAVCIKLIPADQTRSGLGFRTTLIYLLFFTYRQDYEHLQ